MNYADYRPWLPGPEQSRIAGNDAKSHAAGRMATPRAQSLFREWAETVKTPFKGLTTEGEIRKGLFSLRDENAPAEAMSVAANSFIAALNVEERKRTCQLMASEQWRNWQNTEIFVDVHGLRLEFASDEVRALFLEVMRVSLSDKGYENAIGVMKLNAFLGDLLDAPNVIGQWSYNFAIFGNPSQQEPWGWQLWGHHLAINCVVIDRQMVLTPCFMGAEICYADQGSHAGLALFKDHERKGLQLMNSLPDKFQSKARLGYSLAGDDLAKGRVHFADYLMLGGAYQDNRIVPMEGINISDFSRSHRNHLLDLVEEYIGTMPDGPRAAKMEAFERHLSDTHFCWIGGSGPGDPFYYRIQSPITFIEFDHHPGLFLTNTEALKFHVHTVVRTPNGNDYGIDLLRQHYQKPGGHHSHGHSHSHSHSHGHGHGHDH